MSPEGVVLRTKTCGIGPIRAHHRPKSKRLDTSKQKSSPTSRHKTAPEQFKHIFATSLHGPQCPQRRSKLKESTSGAVREASFTPREPRNGCPNQAVAHRRCEFYQGETHVFTKWRNFRHRTGFMWPMTSRGALLCSQMRFAQGKMLFCEHKRGRNVALLDPIGEATSHGYLVQT